MMRSLYKIGLALALSALSLVGAQAQGVGQLGSGQVWGNAGASRAPASPTDITALIDRAFTCSARGSLLQRGASGWSCLAPGAAGLPLTSAGTGADLAYATVALSAGGLNASLTASNGGIVYSTATGGAILAGTATARQMLQSGANAAPAWSTATWPATTTINQLLYSSAANTVAGLATANSGVLITNGSGVPSIAGSTANTVLSGGTVPAFTATPSLGSNGGTGGSITLNGSTSGSAVLGVVAAAGTTTFKLPVGNGSNGNALITDGAGNTSWSAAGAGTVTSVGVTAGTGITQSGSPVTSTGNITVNVDKATTSNAWAATSNKVTTTDVLFNGVGVLQSLSGTSSVTPDFSTGRNFVFTGTSATNFTLNTPTNTHIGDTGCILFFQPASGTTVNITFGANWVTPGGVSGKALTQTLGALDIVCYLVVNSTPSIAFTLTNGWTH